MTPFGESRGGTPIGERAFNESACRTRNGAEVAPQRLSAFRFLLSSRVVRGRERGEEFVALVGFAEITRMLTHRGNDFRCAGQCTTMVVLRMPSRSTSSNRMAA